MKPGDKLTRVIEGFKNKPNWENEAIIESITKNTVTCKVLVDQWRTMKFNRNTGIAIDGIDFGWIKEIENYET